MTTLAPSRLFSFLDDEHNYVVTFLEGQKLVQDFAISHGGQGFDLDFFRDAILCAEHIIQFFKNDENLGFYIDSMEPNFHFKLETNSQGYVRALLLPEDVGHIPKAIDGVVRLVKKASYAKEPYQSVIEVTQKDIPSIINEILQHSDQINAYVFLSPVSDQSVMVSRLPIPKGREQEHFLSPKEYFLKFQSRFMKVFKMNLNDGEKLVATMTTLNKNKLAYLSATDIQQHCPCSKEGLLVSIRHFAQEELDDETAQGRPYLDLKCHYCNKVYRVDERDLQTLAIN